MNVKTKLSLDTTEHHKMLYSHNMIFLIVTLHSILSHNGTNVTI
jgi:hypothetical protein